MKSTSCLSRSLPLLSYIPKNRRWKQMEITRNVYPAVRLPFTFAQRHQRPKFSVPCSTVDDVCSTSGCLLVHEVWRRRPKERTLLRHLTACFSVFSRSPLILACVFKKLKEEDRKSVNNWFISWYSSFFTSSPSIYTSFYWISGII